MTEVDPYVHDKLHQKIEEYKKISNKLSLVLIFWGLLIALGFLFSNSNPALNDMLTFLGAISLAPVLIMESIIISRLIKIKREKSELYTQKTLYEKSLDA